MSKWDKLLKRISTLSKDFRLDELRKVLESYVLEKISQAPEFGDTAYLDDLLPWSPALPENLITKIVEQ